jgi:hypothetical protein
MIVSSRLVLDTKDMLNAFLWIICNVKQLPKEMMMSASPDALAEIQMFGLDDSEHVGPSAPAKRNGINSEQDDIENDRRAILEISRMADRMSSLLQETRNINVETDERLRRLEADLSLIASEK